MADGRVNDWVKELQEENNGVVITDEDLSSKKAEMEAMMVKEFAQGKQVKRRLLEIAGDETAPAQGVAQSYWESIIAWINGVNIPAEIIEDYRRLTGDESLTAADLGLWLQNDNFGCGTIMFRTPDKSVRMIHTEEDETFKLSRAQMVTMRIGGEQDTKQLIRFFSYPHLLPGSTFGWRVSEDEVIVQTINYLPLDEPESFEGKMLANVYTWAMLMQGDYEQAEQLLQDLGPYADGYTVNLVRIQSGDETVKAKSITFARDQVRAVELGGKDYDRITQVNCLPPELKDWHRLEAGVGDDNRSRWYNRLRRLNRMVDLSRRLIRSDGDKLTFDVLFCWIASRIGRTRPLSRKDVKGNLIAEVSNEGIEAYCLAGPATKDDGLHGRSVHYLDEPVFNR
jgi:hypothetical protein